jgi:hypothetical protein
MEQQLQPARRKPFDDDDDQAGDDKDSGRGEDGPEDVIG